MRPEHCSAHVLPKLPKKHSLVASGVPEVRGHCAAEPHAHIQSPFTPHFAVAYELFKVLKFIAPARDVVEQNDA